MAIEKKEVSYAKEVDDVAKLLVELVEDVRSKKAASELVAENLPNLMAAISGLDQIAAELKADQKVVMATLGSRLGELAAAIIGPPKAE